MNSLLRRIDVFICMSVLIMSLFPHVSTATELPDIAISNIDIPNSVEEGDTVEINVTIQNMGDVGISGQINIAFFVDDSLVQISNVTGLEKNTKKTIHFIWIAEYGEKKTRIISIRTDYDNRVYEKNEYNNDYVTMIDVFPKPTDLLVLNVSYVKKVDVNEETTINVKIKNTGHDVDDRIAIKLTIGEYTDVQYLENGISLNSEKNVYFSWIPDGIGYYNISICIDPSDEIEESNESNNCWKGTVAVEGFMPWWNETWHYRIVVLTQGKGKVSRAFNFTGFLHNLSIENASFDNNSLRVIEYGSDGKIIGETAYFFNESEGYDDITKATGVLTWNVSAPFSMIYFDTKKNGEKKNNEGNVSTSQNATIASIGKPEGWKIDINEPHKAIYPINSTINITAISCALAGNVNGKLYLEGDLYDTFDFDTVDNETWFKKYELSREGNWTLVATGIDKAGYHCNDSVSFYVGKTDLQAIDISVSSVYENTPATVSCMVRATLPVDNVTVSFYEEGSLIEEKNIPIYGEMRVEFTWIPAHTGYTNISVVLDPNNDIQEKNESNNGADLKVHIKGLPDMKIDKVIVPPSVKEGEPVFVYVHVENVGHATADNCTIALYVSKNSMEWKDSEIVSRKVISLLTFNVMNVTLVWDHALYGNDGRWIVGVEAVPREGDLNTFDNRENIIIQVIPQERNRPIIYDVWCEPEEQYRGLPVSFYADVTDDTGIYDVKLIVTYPNGTEREFLMKEIGTFYHIPIIFNETGTYEYLVRVRDNTFLKNEKVSERGTFEIFEDTVKPDIEKVWVVPNVQMLNKEVKIKTITYDNTGIESVHVVIILPDGTRTEHKMEVGEEGIYLTSLSFNLSGKYTFFITVQDQSGNRACSDLGRFWITSDLNDADDDGIPNWWEERYGFDPYDPEDVYTDEDGDGYNLLQEYRSGLNPLQSNTIFGFSPNEFLIVLVILSMLLIIMVLHFGKKL